MRAGPPHAAPNARRNHNPAPPRSRRLGPEILSGQQAFLQDLYQAAKQQVDAGKTNGTGKTLQQINPALHERNRNWIPRDLSSVVAITYAEITQHKPRRRPAPPVVVTH